MKVLIISHLPMATRNNVGKTLLSIFSEFDREELCQLYIYPAIPDVDRCSSFYRVTDKDVLRSMPFGIPGGEINRSLIRENAGLYENPEDESFYRNRKNKSALRRLLRDTMWAMSRWDNRKLRSWLDREKPDCIFVAPGQAEFVYNFALKIGKYRDIPIVSYIFDEYYFVKKPNQLLDQLRLWRLKSRIRALMEASSHLVVICEELREVYSRTFSIECTTVMTGTSYEIRKQPQITKKPQQISYFGNIRCNRYVSLADVGRELDCINEELGTEYRLKIYTSEKDAEILGSFSQIRSVELCGFLTGEAFDKVFHEAELLLHVEAFDEDSIDFVQHSVSTKIADSLASGIPLLAYGPDCVASMQHLIRNECALTASSRGELKQMLLTAFTDETTAERTVCKALAVARECHDRKKTGLRLRSLIQSITAESAD